MLTLRTYQLDTIVSNREAFAEKHRAILDVSPTGSGKTLIAAAMISAAVARGSRALFLADRMELIDQASRKLDEFRVDHGVIMADHWRRRPECAVQVASVPTLHRREGRPHADLVIADEAHKSLAPSYRTILENYLQNGAVIVGLTATPYLYDGRGLGELYSKMIVVAQTADLIRDGWLVPIETFAPSSPELAGVTVKRGDYDQRELEQACDRPTLVGDVVETWKKMAEGRTTCVFGVSKKHARNLQEEFLAAGVKAEYLDDATPLKERRAVTERIASGESTVVSNVGILSLGWDMPRVSCVCMARPTLSKALYLQQVGRGTRPDPVNGKDRLILLDHAGNVWRHGLPEAPQKFSLEGLPKPTKKDEQRPSSIRTCPTCFGVSPAGASCCRVCNEPFPAHERKLVFRNGTLGQVTDTGAAWAVRIDQEEQVRLLAKWSALGNVRGYKPGYALAVFRSSFGRAPSTDETRASRSIAFPNFLVRHGKCQGCGKQTLRPDLDGGLLSITCRSCGFTHRGQSAQDWLPLVEATA